ncbi:MAG: glycosyltransferase [Ferruginibacter sp.]
MIQPAARVKLLIIVPTLECGGLERNVSTICNNLDTSKYDVTLAVLNNAYEFFKITNTNVKLIDLHTVHVRDSLFRILKLTKKIKPDIILSAANHLNLFLAIFKWLFPKNIKIIARESSIVSINTQRSWNPKLYHWLLRVFYKKIDLVICQSKYMQHDLVTNYNIKIEKTHIIYNAVIMPEIKADPHSPAAFARLITVARLSKEKGLDRLIKAVSLLKTPYRFIIIGAGDMRNALQELINERSLQQQIILAGSREQPFVQVPHPDLFLMGSYYEGFPNAMLEAIAGGIPVVAFNAPGGIAELVVNYENGILVEGNDEQEFADAIQKALDFDFDKKQIRESALKRFDVKTIMKEWDELFESLK